jgi:thiamine kinase-like enzyme
MEHNMFHRWEPDSWLSGLYFVGPTDEWVVTFGPKGVIKRLDIGGQDSWAIVGPAHFTPEFSTRFRQLLEKAYATPGTDDWYFEHVLKANLDKLPIYVKRMGTDGVREFESLAELREFDPSYQSRTNSTIMTQIAGALGIEEGEIDGFEPLKNGLTNASFRFTVRDDEFVYRIPQEGAMQWIDRTAESAVYASLAPLDLSDQIVWFDRESGHRITRYLPGARELDASDERDLAHGIGALMRVHQAGLAVAAKRDLSTEIARLRDLCEGRDAIRFRDYPAVAELARRVAALPLDSEVEPVLTHGDFTASNVLVLPDQSVRLIDWELSGMGDPLGDIACFAVAAGFDQTRADQLVDAYLGRPSQMPERRRLYRWITLTALANTLWAEYRQSLGEELGEYPLTMYRYVKDFGPLALANPAPPAPSSR